jgi:hypothetical protein
MTQIRRIFADFNSAVIAKRSKAIQQHTHSGLLRSSQ